MGLHTFARDDAEHFADVVDALKVLPLRPEVVLTEVPAPRRIAPFGVAFSAEVMSPHEVDDVLGSGRFVVLFDPAGQEAWNGSWRIVSFARADLESEMAPDPLLGEVGWSWLLESLHDSGVAFSGEAGTVTRVVNENFGGLARQPASVEIEVRASWTPGPDDVSGHLAAWANLLCTVAGLPPLPEGVAALPGRRS